ncbi:MAG: glycosyl transferase family 1 [Hyphomicrobiales bacterium]|nr:glycosyl transferase family 1 [Hyphomicrobiales bacterium]
MQLPLKVLLTTDAVGGVWTYSLDLAQALRAEGVDVAIAALGPPPSDAQAAQARTTGASLDVLDAPLDWLADDEADVARAARAIAACASRLRADVIQTHSPALIAGIDMPAPVVSVIHSCVATWWDAVRGGPMPEDLRWRARLVREGLARASLNIAPTHAFASAIARVYAVEAPMVVHNARRPSPVGSRDREPFILSAGRFWDESKDLATLDRAASICAWPVVAAGPLVSPFGGRATCENIDARGALDATSLRALYARRPIFCSTAVYEPFGLAVLEAAQAGCALVLADIPTFRELWDGVALFAPPRDAAAFAAAMNALAQDGGRRAALGDAAQARAADFQLARQTREMLALYRRASGRSPAEAAA